MLASPNTSKRSLPVPLRFTEQIEIRGRRFSHLALVRLLLAAAYLAVELSVAGAGSPVTVSAGSGFLLYSGFILLRRTTMRVQVRALAILVADAGFTAALVLLSHVSDPTIPLLLFYFLISESALLHSAREVLGVTALSLSFYSAWVQGGEAQQFEFSYLSFVFLLLVGAGLAYFYRDGASQEESKMTRTLRRAAGAPEPEMAAAVEQTLTELAGRAGCAKAVLAFWDKGLDYEGACFAPRDTEEGTEPRAVFNTGREWRALHGGELRLLTNDLSPPGPDGGSGTRLELHSYMIQKFEIYNAAGVPVEGPREPVGRLLLLNHPSGFGQSHLKLLDRVAPEFGDIARQVLSIKRAEQEAYQRERERLAQDLHDGPLQSILSFGMRLRILGKFVRKDPEAALADLDSLQEIARSLVVEMRNLVNGMRPLESGETSLAASTRRLIDGFQKESGVSVTFQSGGNGDLVVSGKFGTELLQIIREAFHNIYKHAQATHVLLSLGRNGDGLTISIDDNGQGFHLAGKYHLEELDTLRMGPRAIKQRVRELGGDLQLESRPGHGSNLRVTLPLQ